MIPFRIFTSMLKTAAGGAVVTLSGTTIACVGAIVVERTANRTLFRLFPHWYRDVDQAFGVEPYLLEALRTSRAETNVAENDFVPMLTSGTEWMESSLYGDKVTSSQNIFSATITT